MPTPAEMRDEAIRSRAAARKQIDPKLRRPLIARGLELAQLAEQTERCPPQRGERGKMNPSECIVQAVRCRKLAAAMQDEEARKMMKETAEQWLQLADHRDPQQRD